MPASKNALLRFKIIDECLHNKARKWKLIDLQNACTQALLAEGVLQEGVSISRRTIQNDIAWLRRNNRAPIEWDNAEMTYFYEDPHYRFGETLSAADHQILHEKLSILQQFSFLPIFKHTRQLLEKLKFGFAVRFPEFVQFDMVAELRGIQFMEQLYQAIKEKQVLTLFYQPFEEEARTYQIHPYLLKEYNNRWFLLAHTPTAQNQSLVYVFALDRIEGLSVNFTVPFQERFRPSANRFENIIGVTIPEGKQVEQVVISISKKRWPYLQTKPLHKSQQLVSLSEEKATVQFELIVNQELESLFLGYGPDLQVIAPEWLRLSIMAKVKEMAKIYGSF